MSFDSMFDTPPKGTPKYITPEKYELLDNRGKSSYRAEYKIWKSRRVRGYSECDCCGHKEFIGWTDEEYHVGEPYRYSWYLQLFPSMIDDILDSNVLMARLLNENKK